METRLRSVQRFITDHDPQGRTRVSHLPPLEWQQLANGDRFALGYATNTIPVQMNGDADRAVYNSYLADLPGVCIPGGTVLRLVDINPGGVSPMHRTVSLDYGVVLEGEVELVLDSGAKQLLKRGDVVVQRGTNHAWRNTSSTEWARMLYVLQEAQPLLIEGVSLEEDYGGGMDDVKPSNTR
ncbi:hypothetical protein ASPZODRAFT_96353 [Penicilliopsis zonata CBS 506.65]|uniref:Cupin type-2 domain-containing protein n=1 Tax=Penicilliopsis zonata CBS 506.65 TaxID=1073090 RepID=A0A1L9SJV2_9EURO|nr:hypothetical protein ASPZODRAFT_96353 [Penicilliopsis zonata CBS 506.65]OJJ47366.1 hypothetical protein ASPZODRAFT_96353 [Penicilliopsis zonata CBS 506.65]